MNLKLLFFVPFIVILLAACRKSDLPAQGSPDGEVTHTGKGITTASSSYNLTFSDEFDSAVLDTSKWTYRLGPRFISNQLSKNIVEADGYLKISLKKEPGTFIENKNGITTKPSGVPYTSGGIISKSAFTYGYYECRIKMPSGAGWHSSFWLAFYSKFKDEIDIEENDSRSDASDGFQSSYHCGIINWTSKPSEGYNTGDNIYNSFSNGESLPNLADDFHIYGCEVTKIGISFYFDNKLIKRYNLTSNLPGLPIDPVNILLTSVATGAGAKGLNNHLKAVDDSKLPAVVEFDWVRVYTLSD